ARYYVLLGKEREAETFWDRSYQEMRLVPDPRRLEVQCSIAEERIRSGYPDRAIKDASALPVASQRAFALTRVAEAFHLTKIDNLKVGDLEPADFAASTIKEDRWRSSALAAVAKGLARLDRVLEAKRKADECNRSIDKLDAYSAIMIEYHRD